MLLSHVMLAAGIVIINNVEWAKGYPSILCGTMHAQRSRAAATTSERLTVHIRLHFWMSPIDAVIMLVNYFYTYMHDLICMQDDIIQITCSVCLNIA